ncbi:TRANSLOCATION PROTEIN SEC62 [Salix koriyanagi]|uniref:Translocation protein SEC62 n=1 Tax=Salix koriyanagi TaxID=2511006 RepID=A0A9Q0X4B9_9ROSI|nr:TRANSLOCATION PROTEIN SEC62 [Salix koriyanagi]
MKKSGGAADKKRVRRSLPTGTRDLNSDTPPRKQAAEKDVFQLFAEKVRDHKGLVSRWAVLQETRVEYFRGKDFVSFLKNHPEIKDILESRKKKLSTWPAHLEIFPDQLFSKSDAFFAWTFVKRRPLWQTLLSLSWPVLTLAICLFPVYPHGCKLLILYTCAGLLLLILSLLSLRATVFGALYIVLGKRVWLFPNILAEEATLGELFRIWPNKDEEERPKWTTRLFYALVAVLVILLLRHHAPDEAARARYQKRMSNIIDEVIEWSPSLALSGMMEKQPPVVNATEPNDFTDSGRTESEKVPPAGDEGGETVSEQHDDEEIESIEDAGDQHQHQAPI